MIWKALPVQIIELKDGVLLKRGSTELKVTGDSAKGIVVRVLTVASKDGATREEISQQFSSDERDTAEDLIEQLLARHLLVPGEQSEPSLNFHETQPEINYLLWPFGFSADPRSEQFNKQTLVIVGVNSISRRLVSCLAELKIENVQLIDDPCMRNPDLFDDKGNLQETRWGPNSTKPVNFSVWKNQTDPNSVNCLIASSDWGTHQGIEDWNKYCVQNRWHFLPVIIQKLIGYVGPLVVPGETACYECLRRRHNANLDEPEVERPSKISPSAYKAVPFHPSIASILGDIAAFELTKLVSNNLPSPILGSQIEVDLLRYKMTKRKVFKVPRCAVCSPLTTRPFTTTNKPNFVPRGGGIK